MSVESFATCGENRMPPSRRDVWTPASASAWARTVSSWPSKRASTLPLRRATSRGLTIVAPRPSSPAMSRASSACAWSRARSIPRPLEVVDGPAEGEPGRVRHGRVLEHPGAAWRAACRPRRSRTDARCSSSRGTPAAGPSHSVGPQVDGRRPERRAEPLVRTRRRGRRRRRGTTSIGTIPADCVASTTSRAPTAWVASASGEGRTVKPVAYWLWLIATTAVCSSMASTIRSSSRPAGSSRTRTSRTSHPVSSAIRYHG